MIPRIPAKIRPLTVMTATLLLCAGSLAGATDLYQWKDAKGVTHYADAPPPKGTFKSRDISDQAIAPPEAAAQKPVVNANCATAQANLAHLKTAGPVGLDANGDGKPDAVMGDKERTRMTAKATHDVAVFCKQPAPAAQT
jgi:hypothetical protein